MSSKTIFAAFAGIAALAISAGAFAQTTADQNGTIFLNVDVTSSSPSNPGAAYIFDTGLSALNFNGSQSQSFNLANDPNFVAFIQNILGNTNTSITGEVASTSNLFLSYNLLGGYCASTACGTTAGAMAIDYTGTLTSGGNTNSAGNIADAVNNFLSPFLTGGPFTNPSGGSTWATAAADTAATNGYSWSISDDPTIRSTDLGGISSDMTNPGTKLYFYQRSSSNVATGNGLVTKFAGTWLLDANGLLTYTAAVPLPAPLVLLLSGLGLMALVARRGRSFDGAAA